MKVLYKIEESLSQKKLPDLSIICLMYKNIILVILPQKGIIMRKNAILYILIILFYSILTPTNAFAEDILDAKKEESLSEKVSRINLIYDDEEKIKEWSKIKATGNYVIINKKNCSATVYEKDGTEIKEFEVGVGREIGDDLNDTSGLIGKAKNTTPAGEYTLIPNIINKAAYGDLTLSLGAKANKANSTKKVVALHKIPKFRIQERANKFFDGNIKNNRMSHGCINFVEKDFKEFTEYIHGGLKVYVLPEEEGNELMLEKNDKGEYEFVQTKYKKTSLSDIIQYF